MKAWLAVLGGLILGWSWLGPLPAAVNESFTAHMTLHMLVVAIGTPVLAIGLAGTRFDSVRYYPQCFPPVLASLVEMILVWLWHAPAFHGWARHTALGFTAEQVSFALSGWWLWQASFGGAITVGDAQQTERKSAGVLALLLTSMHMTLLGALLALSPRILFHHAHAMNATEQLNDQHLGGAVMLVVGGIAYLCGGLILISQIVGDPRLTIRQGDSK